MLADLDARQDDSLARLLRRAIARERQARELLERGARAAAGGPARALFERLERREREALRELAHEQELLDAEEFVRQALDC